MAPPGTTGRKRDYTQAAGGLATAVAVAAVLAITAWWAWQQPFMAGIRTVYELSRMPAPTALPVPVEDIRVRDIGDTWGAPRSGGRRHQGVDIFAPRGTVVRSTTRGVIVSLRQGGLGGRQVWVLGPARQRHYYAHLDSWAEGLAVGDVVWPGDALGGVGNSGNARGTPTHLHYGVYGESGAMDPLPLLRAGSSVAPGEDHH